MTGNRQKEETGKLQHLMQEKSPFFQVQCPVFSKPGIYSKSPKDAVVA